MLADILHATLGKEKGMKVWEWINSHLIPYPFGLAFPSKWADHHPDDVERERYDSCHNKNERMGILELGLVIHYYLKFYLKQLFGK